MHVLAQGVFDYGIFGSENDIVGLSEQDYLVY